MVRLGTATLKDLQYNPTHTGPLSPHHIEHLRFHRDLVSKVGPRIIRLQDQAQPLVVGYTDAEYQNGNQPRLGGILFRTGSQPQGFTHLVSWAQLAQWKWRHQQIFVAELMAVPVFLARFQDAFRCSDALLFIDNEELWPAS